MMSRHNHRWKVGTDPPLIRPHSLAKHRVLREYLERYVSVLTVNPRQDKFRLTLVDGFAGGGRYLDSSTKEIRPGSPLIMLEAMDAAAAEAQGHRSKAFNLDVQYIFIEQNRHAVAYLRSVLADSKYGRQVDHTVHVTQGEFTEQIDEIIKFVKKRGRAERVIFVLDQFGYSDVPLPTIRRILSSLENAEVILTFATDFLVDYLNEHEECQRILQDIGISLPSKEIHTTKNQCDWRRAIQFALHRQIAEGTGAAFYTPFFIRSVDSHRDFWLVHLSGHVRARDVMLELHWKMSTSFSHYGGSGLRMFGYNQARDSSWTRQRMLPGFYFDETARISSHEELLEQLPHEVFKFPDGITFHDLFSKLTNDSPATAEIMKHVLTDLAKEGVIEVREKSGLKQRRAGIQHGSDIVIPSPQMRLFMK